MTYAHLLYDVALTLIEGIGPVKARTLLRHVGNAEAVFKENPAHLIKIPDIGKALAEKVKTSDTLHRAEQELLWAENHNVQVLHFQDACYPDRLKHCYDFPLILYMRGNADLNNPKSLAIVGTRSMTPYGREQVNHLIAELAQSGMLIVSGLAYGIDITAHTAAMEAKLPTVGVVAHGHDRMYPSVHRHTALSMEQNGGVITE
ncbi:MAG: DNA-protecting protein DprA, partial [Flavobacteriales bacterium]|nr:DNA-protecting protein DprA [Flavobacteriales bacterium]